MPATFCNAPEVETLAQDLIHQYHPHLAEASIAYLFRTGSWSSGDKTTLGKATRETGAHRHLTGYDFVITINADEWAEADERKQEYLVDHELCHCGRAIDEHGHPATEKDGSPKWCIIKHDLEEFAACVRRHGVVTNDQKVFIREARQLTIEDAARELKETLEAKGMMATLSVGEAAS